MLADLFRALVLGHDRRRKTRIQLYQGLVRAAPVLLHVDPEHELALLVPVEGGGDDAVAAGRELEALGDLAQVDEAVCAGDLRTRDKSMCLFHLDPCT